MVTPNGPDFASALHEGVRQVCERGLLDWTFRTWVLTQMEQIDHVETFGHAEATRGLLEELHLAIACALRHHCAISDMVTASRDFDEFMIWFVSSSSSFGRVKYRNSQGNRLPT